jgi:hypothetical protein
MLRALPVSTYNSYASPILYRNVVKLLQNVQGSVLGGACALYVEQEVSRMGQGQLERYEEVAFQAGVVGRLRTAVPCARDVGNENIR